MASLREEIAIDAAPGQVWAAVRDVGAVHRRLVPGHVVDTRIEGDTRILAVSSGGVVRELIVAVDDEARRLAYAVVEGRNAARASPRLIPGVCRRRGPQPPCLDHRFPAA